MSKKGWHSSKQLEVSGKHFIKARAASIKHEIDFRGEYGEGSQGWLAKKSGVSLKTIQNLEEKNKATIKTVDAISQALGIPGREYIKSYGADFTTFAARGVVDFRSAINGRLKMNHLSYFKSPFFVTIDPLLITVSDEFIETSTLSHMSMNLKIEELEIGFEWLYTVTLTNRSKTWLGDEEDVSQVNIYTNKPYNTSVMFRQSSLNPMSWGDFVNHVKNSNENQITLTVKLNFEHFEVQDQILVSITDLKTLFKRAKKVQELDYDYPYWVQPKALMP